MKDITDSYDIITFDKLSIGDVFTMSLKNRNMFVKISKNKTRSLTQNFDIIPISQRQLVFVK